MKRPHLVPDSQVEAECFENMDQEWAPGVGSGIRNAYGHHHEIVQLELVGQGVCPQHVDKEPGFVLGLKKRSVHIGLTPGEKRPSARDDITPVRFSGELYLDSC